MQFRMQKKLLQFIIDLSAAFISLLVGIYNKIWSP